MHTSRCLLIAAMCLYLPAAAGAEPSLRDRAAAVVASLDDDQRDDARWRFDDDEREDIHFAPIGLDGVEHRDLGPESASLVESLLGVALSSRGMQTVRDVRNLELAVREKESGGLMGFFFGGIRDPYRYLLAVFGEPEGQDPWAFRYEGHHLSLNVTDVNGRPLSTTPLFVGAEPRVVPDGWPSAGVAVLGEEERLARALYASLPDALRARATLQFEDGRGSMLGEVRRVAGADSPSGVARSELPEPAKALLDDLVERFVGLWNTEAAAARRSEIEASGRDAIHFSFSQGDDPENAFYVRLQGPRLLIEIDNTSDGDHIHAVWHDLTGDFGDDVLADHWRTQHGVSLAAH
jgi:hypothetical protein